MISAFIEYLGSEKRLSPHTLLAYQTDLLQGQEFLCKEWQIIHIQDADYQQLRSWVAYLVEIGLDSRSVNRKIATLRSFYRFCLKRQQLLIDPSSKLKALKTAKKLPNFIQTADMQQIAVASFPKNFAGLRDQLVIELLYGTGMRLSELLGLKDTDINEYQKQIKVLGKRNKERIIPVHDGLLQLLKQYLLLKTQNSSISTLLVTDNGLPAYPVLIQRITKKYLLNIGKNNPHVLRHTFATHLLNEGADLNAIKDLLGHSSLAATQVYTHNSIKKLKDIYTQAHPKA
jgi:integrase/recombinase XerC